MGPADKGMVRLNLRGFLKLSREQEPGDDRMYQQWRARYLGYTRRRFVKYSKGGGDWEPLSASTIAGRRKGKGGGKPAILRDTGTMFGMLDVSRPDNFKRYRGAIKVGFLGGERAADGDMTVAQLASIHNFGLGANPERKIIDQPDRQTIDGLNRDLMAAQRRRLQRNKIK